MTNADFKKLWKNLSEYWKSEIAKKESAEHIHKLILKSSIELKCDLAENPHISAEVIGKLLSDKSKLVRASIAKSTLLTKEQVDELLTDKSIEILEAVASRENLSDDQIEVILDFKKLDIIISLLKNPNLSSKKLDEISKIKKTPTFLKVLASNPSISQALKDKFIKHKNEEIKWALTKNPNLTEEDILRLIEDEEFHYSLSSTKINLSKEVLDILVESAQDSSLMRQNLTWRSDLDKSHFKTLLQDDDTDNIKSLAENKNIPLELLEALINHERSKVREVAIREFVKRQCNDQKLLLKLAKEVNETEENSKLRVIAQYATKPSDEMLKILMNAKSEDVRRSLIFNRNRPLKALEHLRDNDPIEGIRNMAEIRLRWENEERNKLPEYLKVLKNKFGFGTYLPDFDENDCIGGTKSENGLPDMNFVKKLKGYEHSVVVVGYPKSLRLEF